MSSTRLKAESKKSPSGSIPLLDCHGATETGRRRRGDQDDFLLAALPLWRDFPSGQDPAQKRLFPSPGQTGFLFVVADGVGGVPCGDRASSMAVKSLSRYLKHQSSMLEKATPEIFRTLRGGIRRCQADLQAELSLHPECFGMSTTLTGALALARQLYVVHSGDSRCYLLRGSSLRLVTHDHTRAQMNIEAGTVDPTRARIRPGGNHLWNFLTSDYTTLRPDVGSIRLEPGDILLLCTDGVSDALPPEEIQRHLSSKAPAEGIVDGLIAGARERGNGDDLTAVVGRFAGPA